MKKIIIFTLFLLPSITYAANTNISKIVFTSDPRSVAVGEISEAITVQTQNANGEEEKLDGTADAVFTSSSATGEFLGSTGKEVTKTMNSGSANKTLYYRDSTEGVHTITVTVTPRTGGTGWTATQNVYVGVDAPAAEGGGASGGSGNDGGGNSNTSSGVGSNSTHSSPKNLSTYKKSQVFKMSAGRNRTVLVNTPIYFEAETNTGDTVRDRSIDFKWSFGDGDSDGGPKARHIYYFPGEYSVVLSAYNGKEESISIIRVKVLENILSIPAVVPGLNGYVEIKNGSNADANIKGWEIKAGNREYLISGDTIIDAKKSIRIPNKIMGFSPELDSLQLLFPTDEVAYDYKEKTKSETTMSVATVSKEEQDRAMAYYYENFAYDIDPDQEALPPDPVIIEEEVVPTEIATSSNNNQAAAVAEGTELMQDKSKGFWGFVRRLFSVE